MTLAELVRQQQEKALHTPVEQLDWAARRNKWLAELTNLMSDIKTWLSNAGIPSDLFESRKESIHEETLGRYSATGLRVRIGTALVTFRPIGSILIGAYGRVDVFSDQPGTPTVKLIADLEPSHATESETSPLTHPWIWLVYPGRQPGGGERLNENSLARVLAIVLGEAA